MYKNKKWFLYGVLFGLLTVPFACSFAQTIPVTYTWAAPTTGSTAIEYNVYRSLNGGAFELVSTVPDTLLSANGMETHVGIWSTSLDRNQKIVIYVTGLNSWKDEGVASIPSNAIERTDPGACGKPSAIIGN